MKLTCVLATRGRPQMLQMTVLQTLANMRESSTRLLICADADDTETVKVVSHLGDERLQASVREREDDLGSKYNRALTEAPADVYLHMVDYAPVVTEGFDAKVLDAAGLWQDGIGLIETRFAHDISANLTFCPAQGITARFAECLGFIYPTYFPFWFVDHWVLDVAKMIGRIGFADVKVDTRLRPGTQEHREAAWWATFYDVTAPLRRRQAEKLIRELYIDPLDREILLRHFPIIEDRSRIVNNLVRQQGSASPGLHSERYLRAKNKASALIYEIIAETDTQAAA